MSCYQWWVSISASHDAIRAASGDMKRVIEHSPVPLSDGSGEGGTSPIQPDGSIYFTGVGNERHEPFYWPPRSVKDWTGLFPRPFESQDVIRGFLTEGCKAGHHAEVATVIAACLLAAKHHLGHHILLFDEGQNPTLNRSRWELAAALFHSVVGFQAPQPSTEQEAEFAELASSEADGTLPADQWNRLEELAEVLRDHFG
jgi:hypothetical protein